MKHLLLPLLIFAPQVINAGAPSTLWTKTFGGSSGWNDRGFCVEQLEDSGYIVGGINATSGKFNIYVIRTDKSGDTLWTRTYEGISSIGKCFIVKVHGKNEFFVGGSDDNNAYLIKIDSLGDTLWTRTYNWYYIEDDIENACQSSDNGFITINGWGFITKFDSLGDTVWTKSYYLSSSFHSIKNIVDVGYVITGSVQISGEQQNGILIRIDENGDTVWTRTYGGTSWDVFCHGIQSCDSGFVMTGYTDMKMPNDNDDIWLLKTDKNGNKLWEKTFAKEQGLSLYDEGLWVEQTSDSGFVITGYTDWIGGMNIWLVKTDKNGNKMWDTTFCGASDFNIGYCVKQTFDKGFILTGIENGDVALIKTGEETAVEESNVVGPDYNLAAFPNPFITSTNIRLSTLNSQLFTFSLYDISGKLVEKTAETVIGKNLKPGIYFLRINNYKPVKLIKLSHLK